MSDNTDAKKKLEGQRAAIRLHIKKFNDFPHQQDKDFALKTIRRAQHEIAALKKSYPVLNNAAEDNWSPVKKGHY